MQWLVFVGDESVSLEMRSLFGSERPGPSKPSEEESFSKKANVVLALFQVLGSRSGQRMLSLLITRGRWKMSFCLCVIFTRFLMV